MEAAFNLNPLKVSDGFQTTSLGKFGIVKPI